MDPDTFKNLEQEAGILESIANHYGPGSKEYATVKRAAFALHYVLTQDYNKFAAFVREYEQELTAEQKAHLAKLGLDFEKS